MNIKTILKAWAISFNPNDKQQVLAEARLEVCSGCDKFSMLGHCKACGCPVKKKIYTDEYNPCPLHKWKDADDTHFDKSKIKTNKSII
jgi:hypothetical protein